MRIFAYIPDCENADNIALTVDQYLPEPAYEVLQSSNLSEFIGDVETLHYEGILVVVDEAQTEPFHALEALNKTRVKGPIVCLFQNNNNHTLFNVLNLGAISATNFDDIKHKRSTLNLLIQNAVLAFKGNVREIVHGPIKLNSEAKSIHVNNTPLKLTSTEFKIFEALLTTPDRLYSRSELQNLLYSIDNETDERTIDGHLKRLRTKLKKAQAGLQRCIHTAYGLGYKFTPPDGEQSLYSLSYGDLVIDLAAQEAQIKGKRVDLKISEFMILKTFMINYPETPSFEELQIEASKFGAKVLTDRGVEKLIKSLCSKLSDIHSGYSKLISKSHTGFFVLDLNGIDDKAAQLIRDDITLGPLKLNQLLERASFNKAPLNLTAREFEALKAFAEAFPKPLFIEDLSEIAYGTRDKGEIANAQLGTLKRKLREANGGSDFIQYTKGIGHAFAITDQRSLKKAQDSMDLFEVGPWTVNKTLGQVDYRPDDHASPITVPLRDSQFKLSVALLEAYPSALDERALVKAVYGEDATVEEKKDALVLGVWPLLKKNVTLALGETENEFRRTGDDLFRLDLPFDSIPEEITKQCEISEVGPWAINHTAHILMFDGDPIATTDKEFSVMADLIRSYPEPIPTQEMYDRHFNGNKPSFHPAMSAFKKKLAEGYNITTELLEEIKKGRIGGYVLRIDRRELNPDQIQSLGVITLNEAEYDPYLGTIKKDELVEELNETQNFCMKLLVAADKPLSPQDVSKIAADDGKNLSEDYLYTVIEVELKAKLAKFGIKYGDSKRSGYFLEANESQVTSNSDITELGPLKIDNTLLKLTAEGKTIDLLPYEHRILSIFAENPLLRMQIEEVISRSQKIDDLVNSENTFRQARHFIHAKLREADVNDWHIFHTKRGSGYCMSFFRDAIDTPAPSERAVQL